MKSEPTSVIKNAKDQDNEEEKDELKVVDLTSRMYKLVVIHTTEGVLQSEVWKELGLSSRDGSRIAIRLEKRGIIERGKVLANGRWTYKLKALRLPVDFRSIELIPCTICAHEKKCRPDGIINPCNCPLEREEHGLVDWTLNEYNAFLEGREPT
ncbi:MAG: transcriptional regulator [Thaumarchaeota archaeon]|nr:transcriptional regulator [Nitrososphaerota archaeon]MCZ6724739.1 transcriptional regulator [Nitrososphaerota archaeon]